ncbi:Elp4 [Phodopus roborovskii]|uniref:Elongator complex protein 4 n=1 Tax=Phodopus roborovskii TaxID=109678 RepID=A0AAU9Z8Z9_PHORO|nr:Elp4 [Phodopus roborovskii]
MAAAATCSAGVLSSGCVASTAGPSGTTSFQRRSKTSGADAGGPRLLSIAGTRPSVRNGQLLVSTGLPALDQLLEEDKYNIYSPLLFKYFLAEGIVNGHTLLVASAKEKPANILQKKQKNILRIGIQSFGSPLWGDDICCTENCNNSHRLTKFLYVLRGLLRASLSACIITMPTHLIQNKAIITRVRNLSDTVVGLESFIGSEKETNPLYKDYHGLIHIWKIPRLNNLTCDESDVKDLAFKLKRKLFTIEQLIVNQASSSSGRSSLQEC